MSRISGLFVAPNTDMPEKPPIEVHQVSDAVWQGRANRKEAEQIETFSAANRQQTGLQNKAGMLTAIMNPVTYVIVNLAVILLIRNGAFSVNDGIITQGEVVALVNYMGQILVELVKMATSIFTVTKAVACGNRIGAVLDMPAGMAVAPAPDGTRHRLCLAAGFEGV